MASVKKAGRDTSYPGKELEVMSHAVNYHRWIVEEITPYLGDVAVEVGAGIGDLTQLLLATPLQTIHAFEPSDHLCSQLAGRFHSEPRVEVTHDFFDPEKLEKKPDSVVYINVLEHIDDDFGELQMVARALPAGGALVIFVPALSWLYSEADRSVGHFRRYHKKPLVSLVERAGFSIEKARYFDLAGVLPWYLNFVLLKNDFQSGSVVLYDRLVVPPMKVFERIFRPPIGKNILLVAKKV